MNLGYGAPITLSEFIHIYEELIGKDAVTEIVPAPLTEPTITYCDNARARPVGLQSQSGDRRRVGKYVGMVL